MSKLQTIITILNLDKVKGLINKYSDKNGASINGAKRVLAKIRWKALDGKIFNATEYLISPYNLLWNFVNVDYRGMPFEIYLNHKGLSGDHFLSFE